VERDGNTGESHGTGADGVFPGTAGLDDEGYLLVDTRSGRFVQCRGRSTEASLSLPPPSTVPDHPFDLALGHRRLSIVDLTPAGHQPRGAPGAELWIVFNGMPDRFTRGPGRADPRVEVDEW
jgi:hypothetical protein